MVVPYDSDRTFVGDVHEVLEATGQSTGKSHWKTSHAVVRIKKSRNEDILSRDAKKREAVIQTLKKLCQDRTHESMEESKRHEAVMDTLQRFSNNMKRRSQKRVREEIPEVDFGKRLKLEEKEPAKDNVASLCTCLPEPELTDDDVFEDVKNAFNEKRNWLTNSKRNSVFASLSSTNKRYRFLPNRRRRSSKSRVDSENNLNRLLELRDLNIFANKIEDLRKQHHLELKSTATQTSPRISPVPMQEQSENPDSQDADDEHENLKKNLSSEKKSCIHKKKRKRSCKKHKCHKCSRKSKSEKDAHDEAVPAKDQLQTIEEEPLASPKTSVSLSTSTQSTFSYQKPISAIQPQAFSFGYSNFANGLSSCQPTPNIYVPTVNQRSPTTAASKSVPYNLETTVVQSISTSTTPITPLRISSKNVIPPPTSFFAPIVSSRSENLPASNPGNPVFQFGKTTSPENKISSNPPFTFSSTTPNFSFVKDMPQSIFTFGNCSSNICQDVSVINVSNKETQSKSNLLHCDKKETPVIKSQASSSFTMISTQATTTSAVFSFPTKSTSPPFHFGTTAGSESWPKFSSPNPISSPRQSNNTETVTVGNSPNCSIPQNSTNSILQTRDNVTTQSLTNSVPTNILCGPFQLNSNPRFPVEFNTVSAVSQLSSIPLLSSSNTVSSMEVDSMDDKLYAQKKGPPTFGAQINQNNIQQINQGVISPVLSIATATPFGNPLMNVNVPNNQLVPIDGISNSNSKGTNNLVTPSIPVNFNSGPILSITSPANCCETNISNGANAFANPHPVLATTLPSVTATNFGTLLQNSVGTASLQMQSEQVCMIGNNLGFVASRRHNSFTTLPSVHGSVASSPLNFNRSCLANTPLPPPVNNSFISRFQSFASKNNSSILAANDCIFRWPTVSLRPNRSLEAIMEVDEDETAMNVDSCEDMNTETNLAKSCLKTQPDFACLLTQPESIFIPSGIINSSTTSPYPAIPIIKPFGNNLASNIEFSSISLAFAKSPLGGLLLKETLLEMETKTGFGKADILQAVSSLQSIQSMVKSKEPLGSVDIKKKQSVTLVAMTSVSKLK